MPNCLNFSLEAKIVNDSIAAQQIMFIEKWCRIRINYRIYGLQSAATQITFAVNAFNLASAIYYYLHSFRLEKRKNLLYLQIVRYKLLATFTAMSYMEFHIHFMLRTTHRVHLLFILHSINLHTYKTAADKNFLSEFSLVRTYDTSFVICSTFSPLLFFSSHFYTFTHSIQ